MKIKQSEATKAYKALKKLNFQEVSCATAYNIFTMLSDLQPLWDFQIQEERKIIEKHPKLDLVTGTIKMENDSEKESAIKEAEEIGKEFEALRDMEQEVNLIPFEIDTTQESLKISADDIKALQGFVTFK